MLKPGELAFIKTTGEEVAVLGLTGNLTLPEGVGPVSGTTVIVRRAKNGRDGINHVLDYFLIEELETLEERVRRDKATQKNVEDILRSIGNEEKAPQLELVN